MRQLPMNPSVFLLAALLLLCPAQTWAATSHTSVQNEDKARPLAPPPEPSDATADCLGCHEVVHPGIVEGWKKSRHARTTPGKALQVEDETARKVSSTDVPDELTGHVVGCAECHTLRPEKHKDTFDHNGYEVHVVVSPDDCARCHAVEAEQFTHNKMSHAYGNLKHNKLYNKLELSINGRPALKDGHIEFTDAGPEVGAASCYHCHGTVLRTTGLKERDTELGPMEFPEITGWPNNGVGRVNLDGSLGSCASCHTRHEFSMATARKPVTCKECHNGPDVPAYKVYGASKHYAVYDSLGRTQWNFAATPWVVGQDFTAPTCAVCHISLVTRPDGEVVTQRTHRMNDRLPYRLFGLPYTHAQPKSPDTTIIRDADGLPLPMTLGGKPATKFLIGPEEMDKRKQTMQANCLSCHDASWVNGHWRRMETVNKELDASVRTATELMLQGWKRKLATGLPGNPFDEDMEKKWLDTWLFYANSSRLTSAMAAGGDYGVFLNGRYWLARRIAEMHHMVRLSERNK